MCVKPFVEELRYSLVGLLPSLAELFPVIDELVLLRLVLFILLDEIADLGLQRSVHFHEKVEAA